MDWIRKIEKTDLSNIVLVTKSNEKSFEYTDSLIVVYFNDTSGEDNQYAVVRYTKKWTGWV